MTDTVDALIPVSVLVRRLERRRDELRRKMGELPRWRFRQRQRLLGAIAAYEVEIEDALEHGGRNQHVWNKIRI